MSHGDLPRTDDVRTVPGRMVRLLRPAGRRVLDSRFDVHLHGIENVPGGAHIVAANHLGLVDGPLMVGYHATAIHVLTKREMFETKGGPLLRMVGQIPLDRAHVDPGAVKQCLRVLRDGGAVGIFPEGTRGAGDLATVKAGMAYLALVTGAPVVPLAIFGTRDPGAGINSIPAKGTRVDFVYGAPVPIEAVPFPRTQEQIRTTTAFLHTALRAHLDLARRLTGRELPGPIPDEDVTPTSSTKEPLDD